LADLLTEVLAWCNARPCVWPLPAPLSQQQPMTFFREDDGTVTVEGEPLNLLVLTAEVLEAAHLDYVSFVDGVLIFNVGPAPLHYRPLGPDRNSRTIMFERVQEA
jgi:hypothetical protein